MITIGSSVEDEADVDLDSSEPLMDTESSTSEEQNDSIDLDEEETVSSTTTPEEAEITEPSESMETSDSLTLSSEENAGASERLQARTIASGTVGTAPWEIADDGTLTIGAGTLMNGTVPAKWFGYGASINKIVITGPWILGGISGQVLFCDLSSVTEISGMNFIDTSQVTDMDYMFDGMSSLTSLDVSNFDTSQVTSMQSMFRDTNSLSELTLGSKFNFLNGASNINGAKIPDISPTASYTGKWQNVDAGAGGTVSEPKGSHVLTSAELMTTYDGTTMADTYVWQRVDQTAVNVRDSTIYVGDNWAPEDNFDSAIDRDGNPVDFSQITVTGTVDTNTPGQYDVEYSYDGVSATATITVKDIQTAVNVHDSTIYVGDNWAPQDNFDSAIDRDGNPVDFSQITVSGTVDTNTPGQYDVEYSYDGVSSVATITVKDIQTAVNVHDSTIYVGDSWDPEDNFDSAIDRDGNPVDFSQITVSGTVDTNTPGQYDVTYSYDGVSATATITVVALVEVPPVVPVDPKPITPVIPPINPNNPKSIMPEIPALPGDGDTDGNGQQPSHSNEKGSNNEKKLPQTGTKQNNLFFLLGMGLITLVALVTRKKFKEQK